MLLIPDGIKRAFWVRTGLLSRSQILHCILQKRERPIVVLSAIIQVKRRLFHKLIQLRDFSSPHWPSGSVCCHGRGIWEACTGQISSHRVETDRISWIMGCWPSLRGWLSFLCHTSPRSKSVWMKSASIATVVNGSISKSEKSGEPFLESGPLGSYPKARQGRFSMVETVRNGATLKIIWTRPKTQINRPNTILKIPKKSKPDI